MSPNILISPTQLAMATAGIFAAGSPYARGMHSCRCCAQVNLAAVEQFIRVVGEKEDAIFQRRMRMLQRDKRRREQDKVSPDSSAQHLHHLQAARLLLNHPF